MTLGDIHSILSTFLFFIHFLHLHCLEKENNRKKRAQRHKRYWASLMPYSFTKELNRDEHHQNTFRNRHPSSNNTYTQTDQEIDLASKLMRTQTQPPSPSLLPSLNGCCTFIMLLFWRVARSLFLTFFISIYSHGDRLCCSVIHTTMTHHHYQKKKKNTHNNRAWCWNSITHVFFSSSSLVCSRYLNI